MVLSISNRLNIDLNLEIDFKPALSIEKLKDRLLRDLNYILINNFKMH